MTHTSGDKIADALHEVLFDSSNEAAITGLRNAMLEFKTKHGRSYADVKKQPFARKLINAIEAACREDAR